MAKFYVINEVRVGTNVYKPGDLVDDANTNIVAIRAAGGMLWTSVDAVVAASASEALARRRRGDGDQTASMLSAVILSLGIPSPSWADQQAWYVDAVNGSDENDGAIAAPIKTLNELRRRLGNTPRVGASNATLAINLVSDIPITDPLSLSFIIAKDAFVTIQGTATTVRSGTITTLATRDTATNTRWAITDTAMTGAWTADLGCRVRMTSGTAIGRIAQILKDAGSQTAYVSEFAVNPSSGSAGISPATPTVGDSYVVESVTKVSLGEVFARAEYSGNASPAQYPQLNFRDLFFRSGGATDLDFLTAQVPCGFYGCHFENQFIQPLACVGNTYLQCLFTQGLLIQGGIHTLAGGGSRGNVIVHGGGLLRLDYNVVIQGGCLLVGLGGSATIGRCGIFDAPVSAQVNPSGDGVCIGYGNGTYGHGGTVSVQNINAGAMALWGSGNSGVANTGVGVRVAAGSRMSVQTIAGVTITGTLGDFRCGQSALALVCQRPDTLAAVTINQTWTLLANSTPGTGFVSNAINPANGAAIILRA